MINAKDKFREGFIMLLRPFKFAELKNPLQKFTIIWAYSEQPVIKNILTHKAKEEADLIENCTHPLIFFNKEQREDYIAEKIERLFDRPDSYEKLYEGEIVQCIIDGEQCRFYPDEYKILSKEKVSEIMQEEGYHVLISEELKKINSFKDQSHYLRSRGIKQSIADKWASLSFKGLVIYKPYFQLLTMFCRDYEIYKDEFYEEVEGVNFKDLEYAD